MQEYLYNYHDAEADDALSELEALSNEEDMDYERVMFLRRNQQRELTADDVLTPAQREICNILDRYQEHLKQKVYYGKYLVDKQKIENIFNMPDSDAKDILIENFEDYETEYYSELDYNSWIKAIRDGRTRKDAGL